MNTGAMKCALVRAITYLHLNPGSIEEDWWYADDEYDVNIVHLALLSADGEEGYGKWRGIVSEDRGHEYYKELDDETSCLLTEYMVRSVTR